MAGPEEMKAEVRVTLASWDVSGKEVRENTARVLCQKPDVYKGQFMK